MACRPQWGVPAAAVLAPLDAVFRAKGRVILVHNSIGSEQLGGHTRRLHSVPDPEGASEAVLVNATTMIL